MERALLGLPLLVLFVSPPSDACTVTRYRDVIATADGAAIPAGGGVILESQPVDVGGDDVEVVLSLRVDGKRLDSRPTFIAPRLSVLAVPEGTRGPIELVDSKDRVRLRATQVEATRLLAAPSVRRVTSTAGAVPARPTKGGGNERATIRVELADRAPADAFALVLLGVVGSQPPVGLGARRASAQLSYELDAGGCSSDVQMARQGETVSVAWLDVHGRLSSPSPPLVVEAARGR